MNTFHSRSGLHILTLLSLLLSLLGGALVVIPAQADAHTVSDCTAPSGNPNRLMDTLDAAASGDTVNFSCSGTITLADRITISKNLAIDGSGQTVTLSGGNIVGVFKVNAGFSLSLNNLTILNGKPASEDGGGVWNNGTITINNSTFSGNRASLFGGGLFNNEGTATVTNSTFSGNDAVQGGGIFNYLGTLTVKNSSFTLNTGTDGGGIANQSGTATIANSTFSGNSATNAGGALLVFGLESVNMTILNSTISGNSAANSPWSFGGGIRISGGTATFRNTILANNTGANCSGIPLNGGNNIDDGASCGWSSNLGSMSAIDPLLEALAGSPAYFPLGGSSPAIDTGNNAICAATPVNNTSQNGVTRPQGLNCDIGSYELLDTTTHFYIFLPLVRR